MHSMLGFILLLGDIFHNLVTLMERFLFYTVSVNAAVCPGTLRRCDQGSNRIPGGHPSAMFLHDLLIRPIDPPHY